MARQRSATTLRHQELQDRLLATAEAAIAAEGLANLRARALSEAVGCSVGAIYSVYPDLDALILQVNGRTLAEIDAAMRVAGAGKSPADHLVRLATIYLDFATTHRHRWRALFQHHLPPTEALPAWYGERRLAAFSHIETPLALLQPSLTAPQRALLARTLFSAVHGMVALGLDEKLATLPLAHLRNQIRIVVTALAKGLAEQRV